MDSVCPICFDNFDGKEKASTDICDHIFCVACLEKWAKHGSYCPVDRKRFKKIVLLQSDHVIQVKPRKRKRGQEKYDITSFCEVCGKTHSSATLLLCDCCDLAYHCNCLSPPLTQVPSGVWFCPPCVLVEEKLRKRNGVSEKGGENSNPVAETAKTSFGATLSPYRSSLACNSQEISFKEEEQEIDDLKRQKMQIWEEHNYLNKQCKVVLEKLRIETLPANAEDVPASAPKVADSSPGSTPEKSDASKLTRFSVFQRLEDSWLSEIKYSKLNSLVSLTTGADDDNERCEICKCHDLKVRKAKLAKKLKVKRKIFDECASIAPLDMTGVSLMKEIQALQKKKWKLDRSHKRRRNLVWKQFKKQLSRPEPDPSNVPILVSNPSNVPTLVSNPSNVPSSEEPCSSSSSFHMSDLKRIVIRSDGSLYLS